LPKSYLLVFVGTLFLGVGNYMAGRLAALNGPNGLWIFFPS